MTKLNSSAIQLALMKNIRTNPTDIIVPNYFLGHFECDVLKVSKSGQYSEYEIKISRADFKNDFKKETLVKTDRIEKKVFATYTYEGAVYEPRTKHDMIVCNERCNRFYFVVPEGLIKADEVPPGLGLIYTKLTQWGIVFEVIKTSKMFKAPNATAEKWQHLAANLAYKLTDAKQRLANYKNNHASNHSRRQDI